MAIITVSGLKKYYGIEPNIVRALDGIDIEVEKGEFIAIVGMSGSGKTTLLHLIGGLDKPTEGKIMIAGNELNQMTDEQLTLFRRRNVGFVFQSYNLVPILNVYENIVLPIELDGKSADEAYVRNVMEQLKLDNKRDAMPNQLSGGQQQRVAIARALVAKPSILLADEPTGNLDTKTSQDVLDVLKWSSVEFNQTIMLITHNDYIARLADRTIRIEDGRMKGGSLQ